MTNIIQEKRHCIIKTGIALNGDAIATENKEKTKKMWKLKICQMKFKIQKKHKR